MGGWVVRPCRCGVVPGPCAMPCSNAKAQERAFAWSICSQDGDGILRLIVQFNAPDISALSVIPGILRAFITGHVKMESSWLQVRAALSPASFHRQHAERRQGGRPHACHDSLPTLSTHTQAACPDERSHLDASPTATCHALQHTAERPHPQALHATGCDVHACRSWTSMTQPSFREPRRSS